MSRLAALLKQKTTPANSANHANPHDSISSISKISKGVTRHSCIAPDLEERIRKMATRWRYSEDELAEVLALATANPTGWMSALALDERREQEFIGCGILPRLES